MSARRLLPVALSLSAPVAPELPRGSIAGLLARAAVVYESLRRRYD